MACSLSLDGLFVSLQPLLMLFCVLKHTFQSLAPALNLAYYQRGWLGQVWGWGAMLGPASCWGLPLCYLQTSLPNEVCRQVGTTRWSRLGYSLNAMCRKAVWFGYSLGVNAWWAVGLGKWSGSECQNSSFWGGTFQCQMLETQKQATEMGPYLQETCRSVSQTDIKRWWFHQMCIESYDCHFSNTDTESYWGWQTSPGLSVN